MSETFDRVAWVVVGGNAAHLMCRLKNVSSETATVVMPDAESVPEKFVLLLTRDGKVARTCCVISRSDTEIEVRFAGKRIWTPTHQDLDAVPDA